MINYTVTFCRHAGVVHKVFVLLVVALLISDHSNPCWAAPKKGTERREFYEVKKSSIYKDKRYPKILSLLPTGYREHHLPDVRKPITITYLTDAAKNVRCIVTDGEKKPITLNPTSAKDIRRIAAIITKRQAAYPAEKLFIDFVDYPADKLLAFKTNFSIQQKIHATDLIIDKKTFDSWENIEVTKTYHKKLRRFRRPTFHNELPVAGLGSISILGRTHTKVKMFVARLKAAIFSKRINSDSDPYISCNASIYEIITEVYRTMRSKNEIGFGDVHIFFKDELGEIMIVRLDVQDVTIATVWS